MEKIIIFSLFSFILPVVKTNAPITLPPRTVAEQPNVAVKVFKITDVQSNQITF